MRFCTAAGCKADSLTARMLPFCLLRPLKRVCIVLSQMFCCILRDEKSPISMKLRIFLKYSKIGNQRFNLKLLGLPLFLKLPKDI
jgi:hypothetical protein